MLLFIQDYDSPFKTSIKLKKKKRENGGWVGTPLDVKSNPEWGQGSVVLKIHAVPYPLPESLCSDYDIHFTCWSWDII